MRKGQLINLNIADERLDWSGLCVLNQSLCVGEQSSIRANNYIMRQVQQQLQCLALRAGSEAPENKLQGWSEQNLKVVLLICQEAFQTQNMTDIWQNSLCLTSGCD